MKWLLIGITRKEIREHPEYKLPTNDFICLDRGDFGPFQKGDIDFQYDCFDVDIWRRMITIFGPKSFDVIFMDGGLFGVKRVEEIIQIKHNLLKDNGCIINFSSVVGEQIRCPFGRPLLYFRIPKREYTINHFDAVYSNMKADTFSNKMKKEMRMIL